MTKINPIPGLENKKVNVDVPYLDTTSNTLVISHTDSGIIESLLDTELSTEGGLQIVGWLEGPTGIIWSQKTCDNPKNLGFAVSLGSTYELVSAVYGRGRMLARLSNFTFQCPQDTKKQMKKYGANVPLSAFICQIVELHVPVPAGHEEADEEVRRQRAPLRLHQPEPVPEVFHRQRDDQGVDGQQVVEEHEEGQDQ